MLLGLRLTALPDPPMEVDQGGGQFGQVHRLDEVGVCPQGQAADSLVQHAPGGQDDDPESRELAADPLGHGKAVLARESHIEYEEGDLPVGQQGIQALSAGHPEHPEAEMRQARGQDIPEVVVVLADGN